MLTPEPPSGNALPSQTDCAAPCSRRPWQTESRRPKAEFGVRFVRTFCEPDHILRPWRGVGAVVAVSGRHYLPPWKDMPGRYFLSRRSTMTRQPTLRRIAG